jgi:hypothetical protein
VAITAGPDGEPIGGDQVVRETVEEGVLAEGVGIDLFNIGEHDRDDMMDSAARVVAVPPVGDQLTEIPVRDAVEPVPIPLVQQRTGQCETDAQVIEDLVRYMDRVGSRGKACGVVMASFLARLGEAVSSAAQKRCRVWLKPLLVKARTLAGGTANTSAVPAPCRKPS